MRVRAEKEERMIYKAYIVDFTSTSCPRKPLSHYVLARTKELAIEATKRSIIRYARKHQKTDYQVTIIKITETEEIPSDCIYTGPTGQTMAPPCYEEPGAPEYSLD